MKFKFKKNCRGFGLLEIIILVAILISAGLGGGLYLKEQKSQQELQKIGVEKEKEAKELQKNNVINDAIDTSTWKTYPSAGSGQVATDTSNWKFYRNEKYGFEFDYPAVWILDEYDDSSTPRFLVESKDRIEKGGKFGIFPNGGWGWGPPFNEPEVFATNIAGKKTEVTKWSYFSVQSKELPILEIIRFQEFPELWTKNNRIDIGISDMESKVIIDQILSTFKFIR